MSTTILKNRYYEIKLLRRGKPIIFSTYAQNKRIAAEIAKRKNPDAVVTKVTEVSPPVEDKIKSYLQAAKSSIHKSIPIQQKIQMFRQLHVMLHAGIPLTQALMNLAKNTKSEKLSEMIKKIENDINSGRTLTDAFKDYTDDFGELTISLTSLGEKTGQLSESYKKLAKILEDIKENRTKFKKAIRGPLITLVGMVVAFVILIIVVVPKFKTVFENFHAELPLPTKILINTSNAFQKYGWEIGLGILGVIWFIVMMYKTNYEWRYRMDKLFLNKKFYLINKLIYLSTMHKFSLILAELISAGLSVTEALDSAILMIDNEYMKEKLGSIKPMIEKGMTLSAAMEETGMFDEMIIQMVQAGEESGQVDTMLNKVTEYYYGEFQEIIDNLAAYIEPIMLIFIAALVLLMALGIFMPMWSLGSVVNG